MYGFSDINITLTPGNILGKISEISLWRHYLGVAFTVGKVFSAPYREDTNPSFSVYYSEKNNRYYGRDFGRGFHGDIFNYLEYVYRISFHEALIKVNIDFQIGIAISAKYRTDHIRKSIVTEQDFKKLDSFEKTVAVVNTQIQIARRQGNEEDIQYWGAYGISRLTLNKYNVWPVQKLYVNKELRYIYSKSDPCYAYYFPESQHFKCYFPRRKDKRFIGNIDNNTDIQGYHQCRVKDSPGGLLVLTKSMKDCMLLHELGIDAMAIHGETQKYNSDFVRHIRKYYDRVISLYDRDISGVIGARNLWRDYRVEPFFIDKKLGSKDISDLYRDYGREEVERFIDKIT